MSRGGQRYVVVLRTLMWSQWLLKPVVGAGASGGACLQLHQ